VDKENASFLEKGAETGGNRTETQETERLKAEGKAAQESNTSRKNYRHSKGGGEERGQPRTCG
jgi:hypothetical protein